MGWEGDVPALGGHYTCSGWWTVEVFWVGLGLRRPGAHGPWCTHLCVVAVPSWPSSSRRVLVVFLSQMMVSSQYGERNAPSHFLGGISSLGRNLLQPL